MNPRIRFYLLRLDTVSKVYSKWVLYQRNISTTLDIYPALLGVLSTLYTSTSLESLQVLRPYCYTKSQLVKILVALELTRVYTKNNGVMSMVSRVIEKYREIL